MKKIMNLVKGCIVIGVVIIFMCLFTSVDTEAAGKYYIKVNKRTNVATVYLTSNNKPYKAFLVSCGNATPTGTFYTPAKYRWKTLVGPVYGQYCTRITGSILFHSVWYYKYGQPNTLSNREYNKLGTTCSHGCVRLNVESAKWIYDNCPLSTKVIIFNGSSKNDPLGKPVVKKVSTATKMGWDPTDPNSKNPYNKISFSGVVTGTKTVMQGKSVKVLKGAKAKTARGRNLTSRIKVSIKEPGKSSYVVSTKQIMKLTKVGTYVILYKVTDNITGLSKSHTLKYIVKKSSTNSDDKKPANGTDTGSGGSGTSSDTGANDDLDNGDYEVRIEGLSKSYDVEYMSEINLKEAVKVYNSADEDITDMLEFEIKGPGMSKFTEFEGDMLLLDLEGVYEVVYKVWNPIENKYVKQTTIYNSILKN